MRRFLWIAIGLCLSISLTQGAQAEEWTKSFNITGRAELRVDTSDAQIHVETWNEKKIEAHITSSKWGFGQGGIQVHDHQTGDSVELEVRFPHGFPIMSIGDRRTVIEIRMPVSTSPGATAFTRVPSVATSRARPIAKVLIAPLLAA
jgi:hypothetical protein